MIILIIVILIIILILTLSIKSRISDKKYLKLENKIYLSHKEKGFPKIDKTTQMRMIAKSDYSPIHKIAPEIESKWIPNKLAKEYITVSKSEFKDYLKRNIEILNRFKIENAANKLNDGIWITGNKIIDQERGHVHRTWKIKSNTDIVDVFGDLLWRIY